MTSSTVLLLFGLALASCQPTGDESWSSFKKVHGKFYTTFKEESYRRAVFEDNLSFIVKHNSRFLEGLESYDVAVNEFTDMTDEEFYSTMTGLIEDNEDDLDAPVFDFDPNKPLNSGFDWRNHGAVNPVRSQGSCGSCYAFAAIGTLESHHFLKTGDLLELSEQNAMDCMLTLSQSNDGCNGGCVGKVYTYIKNNEGIDTRESYPYEHKNAECRFNRTTVGATDYGFIKVPFNETALKAAVHDAGPISVTIHAGGEGFRHYHSGVYYDPDCPKTPNHAVIAVGYGHSKNYGDYWLVRNSWGHKWGNEGYIKMARNRDNLCGIAKGAMYPIV